MLPTALHSIFYGRVEHPRYHVTHLTHTCKTRSLGTQAKGGARDLFKSERVVKRSVRQRQMPQTHKHISAVSPPGLWVILFCPVVWVSEAGNAGVEEHLPIPWPSCIFVVATWLRDCGLAYHLCAQQGPCYFCV